MTQNRNVIVPGRGHRAKPIDIVNEVGDPPPRLLEYAYYVSIFYAIMGPTLGLSVQLLGAAMEAVIAAFCVLSLGSRAITVYTPIAFPVACAISYLIVQLLVHGMSFDGPYIGVFVTWMLELTIVQSLCVRQGFFRRFGIAAFVIGLTVLPNVRMGGSSEVTRAALDTESGGGLSNSNQLGAWFGFCAVYLIIVGMESKGAVARLASSLAAIGCVIIVGLTVSRGSLLAVAIATVVALRRVLKHGFGLLISATVLMWIIYETGLFDQITASYFARGTEETGRGLVWPLVIERILESPLTGVAASDVATYVPSRGNTYTPHNSFLFIALSSGVIPLVFFVAYWWRATREALDSNTTRLADAPFRFPLVIYTFLISMLSNVPFMNSWATVALVTAMGPSPRRTRRAFPRRIVMGRAAEHVGRWK